MGAAPSPEEDLALLVRAAHAAGEIALRFWRKSPQAWDKAGGAGPVTEADLAVNDALLAMLSAARPTYGWLSEESPDEPARLDARRTFILDPIDGTRAFIEGQEGFSHALAVVEDGAVTAGVVFLPATGQLYQAHAGGPALLDGQPIVPAMGAMLDGARVLTSRTCLDPALWQGGTVPPLRRCVRPSLAWRLCLVAEGQFDAVLSVRPAWEWDIAAGALIATRAGCTVTDHRGAPLRFNRATPRAGGLLVAPPALHEALSSRLTPPPPGD